jgi:hypothetical protein
MPANGFSLGGDLQLTIVDSQQGIITANIMTMTDFKQLTARIKSVALDGTTRYAELPEGWDVDLDFDKADANLLNYVVANEAAYLGGGQPGVISLSSTINEVNGSVSQYQLSGGALKLTNAGTFKGNDKVPQKASIVFSRMLQTA